MVLCCKLLKFLQRKGKILKKKRKENIIVYQYLHGSIFGRLTCDFEDVVFLLMVRLD